MKQEIPVRLPVGTRVVLYEEATIEQSGGEDVGGTASIFFEGYVEQYVPETGLLEFEDSYVGKAAFFELLEDAAGLEIIYPEDL